MLAQFIKTMTAITAFILFCFGVVAVYAVFEFVQDYQYALNKLLFSTTVIFILMLCGFLFFNAWLAIEYKQIANERFRNDNVELLPHRDVDGDDEIEKPFIGKQINEYEVLEKYYALANKREFSWNKLSMAVYGKKGGNYITELREILQNNSVYP